MFTSEPHQTDTQQLTVYTLINNIQKSYEPWEFQSKYILYLFYISYSSVVFIYLLDSNVTTKIDKSYILQLKTDYQQIMESMIIKKVFILINLTTNR